jgi:tetratricopeptide (TPR) repeat protein
MRKPPITCNDPSIPLLEKGIACHRRRDFLEAEKWYQTVLRSNPKNPEALHLLGVLAGEAQKYDLSIDYMLQAVDVWPDNAVYRANLGNAYISANRADEAVAHLQRAVKLKPGLVEGSANLARALRKSGAAAQALPHIDKALSLDPGRIASIAVRGDILGDLGRLEEAEAAYRSVLAKEPLSPQALAGIAYSKKFRGDEPEFELIEKALARPGMSDELRDILHHAAGKIFNDARRHDEAFHHFERGKQIAGASFDLAVYRKRISQLIATFDPWFFLQRKGCGLDSKQPVFIVGMPRSGTTLTEQIIASHKEVFGAGELTFMRRLAKAVGFSSHSLDEFSTGVRSMTPKDVQALANEYLQKAGKSAGKALRIVDKMPHNYELLGFIALLFPNAKIIHCKRDPMDNCVSIFMNKFNDTHGYNANLSKLGGYYHEYARLMEHWRKVLPLQFLELDYERMVANQEAESRRLIEFLELEWDDACLRYHDTERSVRTISRWQVRQPIYKTSVKRWKDYEKHLGPLKEALGDLAID